ncbi:hypothetical protein LTR56_018015 [Elasticomyces elasticus]|nr:hypothetical protein LTR56_018015 [Elasticomyces elasticus]KAK3652814.1 hypothetical protein LTR22_011478 [Elasticomyces elasticus]KAK4915894.1 hypothetical protein LTR49_016040 [Elasticomyces elasticus]KAK5755340.1 hypothetical protein LTS12_014569 [Elasticomyces elasticus]
MHYFPNTEDSQPCYFTIAPKTTTHFSDETPSYWSPTCTPSEPTPASSTNPLLAHQIASTPWTSAMSSFMQTQTSAAHGRTTNRPSPRPIQNVLHVTNSDEDSNSSDGNDSSDGSADGPDACFGMASPLEAARCSRCQRTPSLDVKSGKSNMLRYGLNLWYCNRCATIVGMPNR